MSSFSAHPAQIKTGSIGWLFRQPPIALGRNATALANIRH